jgi:hypothetical protein
MRRDLGDDQPVDTRLDPASKRRIQEALKNDPKRQIAGIRRFLSVIVWLIVAAALLCICVYYGYVLWSSMKAGTSGEQRYRQMIKENSGD